MTTVTFTNNIIPSAGVTWLSSTMTLAQGLPMDLIEEAV